MCLEIIETLQCIVLLYFYLSVPVKFWLGNTMYSINEKVQIVKWFYAGHSVRAVSDMLAAEFPNRPFPCHSTVRRIIEQFERTGTVIAGCKCSLNAPENLHSEPTENEFNVLAAVAENPKVSLREIAANHDMHYTTAQKILKKYKFHSYRYPHHQELLPQDVGRREEFCYSMMEKANEDTNFLRNICFTDECTFTLHNAPNNQNCRMWATQNPRLCVETRTQYPKKVNLWAGILGHRIIGPFVIEGNLTGDKYLELLEDQITPALNEAAGVAEEIWFQMDGCPAHNTRNVRRYLNESFDNKVIGNGYTINWPARSPDLSPNDFFLWGHLKSKIYNGNRCENIEELTNRIRNQCARISPYQLANMRREFYDRLGYCLTVNGGLFEHLL